MLNYHGVFFPLLWKSLTFDNPNHEFMNIETIREYCLSQSLVTEDFPFDETTLVFRVLGKIFACLDQERPEWVTMKCDLRKKLLFCLVFSLPQLYR